jgi:ATPase subunit of ABC transporter with duplicated ATPase domains
VLAQQIHACRWPAPRVELARILFAASRRRGRAPSATTLLLDEPTNHLDADSITWLRSFLPATTAAWW